GAHLDEAGGGVADRAGAAPHARPAGPPRPSSRHVHISLTLRTAWRRSSGERAHTLRELGIAVGSGAPRAPAPARGEVGCERRGAVGAGLLQGQRGGAVRMGEGDALLEAIDVLD